MLAAEAMMNALADAGVTICFTNPGTTEIHLVAALQAVPRIRAVLGLFEGVCSGAADGFARMTGRPAATLLHLGPGLSNAMANLHNARRARSPVVNLVGDHPARHRSNDPPLASDIVSLAGPVSGWVREATTAAGLPADGRTAVQASLGPPGQVATLIVPADCAWGGAERLTVTPARPQPRPISDAAVAAAARMLQSGTPTALLIDGQALLGPGLAAAARIAQKCGAELIAPTFAARFARGAGFTPVKRLPYFPERARKRLSGYSQLILAGAVPPTAFFAYPDQSVNVLPPQCRVETLAGPQADAVAALEALAEAVAAGPHGIAVAQTARPAPPTGVLNAQTVGQAIGALLPENAIVSDESGTSGEFAYRMTAGAPPHDWLCLTGGSIGQGIPVATGAALACPERKVLCLQGDGGAMYTLQALWTQARESLDVTTIIFSNRKYQILQIELQRLGFDHPGQKMLDLMDLSRPEPDWIRLAGGLGVSAERAQTIDHFIALLQTALAESGPHLIEVPL